MNKFKKLFFEQELTWAKLIIFSVICGVITGIIPLIKFLDKTSIHNIAECYEAWVFLAMIIILNSKKPIEAGIKTFVFFLISQPLCYLVQVPFYDRGFEIFNYYPFWAMLTVLTFPGAIIAWFTKKKSWLSVVILSVANFLLASELVAHGIEMLKSFPYKLLSILFIIFEIILFAELIFDEKKKKICIYIITVAFCLLAIYRENKIAGSKPYLHAVIELENADEYTVVEQDENIEILFFDDLVNVKTQEPGEYYFTLENKDGKVIKLYFNSLDELRYLEIVNEEK